MGIGYAMARSTAFLSIEHAVKATKQYKHSLFTFSFYELIIYEYVHQDRIRITRMRTSNSAYKI